MNVLLIYGLMAAIPGLFLLFISIFGAGTDIDVDTDLDLNVDAGDLGGPGALSVKLILFFLVGFGASGYLTVYFKWPVHHVLSGLIGGGIAWFIGYRLLKFLYEQQSSSQVQLALFVGAKGRVVVPIPKDGGTGEIEATNEKTGQSTYFNAKAIDPSKEYQKGAFVTIKSVSGRTAIVG